MTSASLLRLQNFHSIFHSYVLSENTIFKSYMTIKFPGYIALSISDANSLTEIIENIVCLHIKKKPKNQKKPKTEKSKKKKKHLTNCIREKQLSAPGKKSYTM